LKMLLRLHLDSSVIERPCVLFLNLTGLVTVPRPNFEAVHLHDFRQSIRSRRRRRRWSLPMMRKRQTSRQRKKRRRANKESAARSFRCAPRFSFFYACRLARPLPSALREASRAVVAHPCCGTSAHARGKPPLTCRSFAVDRLGRFSLAGSDRTHLLHRLHRLRLVAHDVPTALYLSVLAAELDRISEVGLAFVGCFCGCRPALHLHALLPMRLELYHRRRPRRISTCNAAAR